MEFTKGTDGNRILMQWENQFNRIARKRTLEHVRPAKIQIRLRIRAVWSESSLGAFWIAEDAKFLHADNEGSDQNADAQGESSLRFVHMCKGTFSHVSAHLIHLGRDSFRW